MRRLILVVVTLAVAGCSLDNLPTPRATYRPVPDAQLYSRIMRIPGVVGAELRWTNGFDSPNGYGGTIDGERTANAAMILDRALAILWQGRPGADLGAIEVISKGDLAVFPSEFGLKGQADYAARYGPQPGTGVPPATPLIKPR